MRHNIRWTSEKISRRIALIEAQTYILHQDIPPFRYCYQNDPMGQPAVDPELDDSSWDVIHQHEYWANPRTNFTLRSRFRIQGFDLAVGPIALFLPIGIAGDFSHPEALVYIDGKPYAACDRHHQEVLLADKYCDGEEHTLALHGWTGIGGATVGDMTNRLKMNACKVVQIHQPTRDFVALARVAHGISTQLEDRNPARHHLLTAIDEAFKLVDLRNPIGPNFYGSISTATEKLRDSVEKAGHPLDVNISAIGHAHIDVAWLWTLGQTR